ncbi:MAG: excisionase [Pseudogulbenkiania sp.]|nr:excisionase [Pseudogulbenkiania sp.]
MKIPLAEWAAREFSQPPHRNTLTKWVANGHIQPQPVFIGRQYFVEEGAKFIGGTTQAPPRKPHAPTPERARKPRLIHRI